MPGQLSQLIVHKRQEPVQSLSVASPGGYQEQCDLIRLGRRHILPIMWEPGSAVNPQLLESHNLMIWLGDGTSDSHHLLAVIAASLERKARCSVLVLTLSLIQCFSARKSAKIPAGSSWK